MLLYSFFFLLQTPKFLTVALATPITFSEIVSHICTSSLFLSHSAFNPGIPRLPEWFIFSLYPLRCNLLCCKILYVDKRIVSCIPSCSTVQRSSAWEHSLYFTCVSSYPGGYCSVYHLYGFAFSRVSCSWNHRYYVGFSNWLCSPNNMYLRVHVFMCLDSSFLSFV